MNVLSLFDGMSCGRIALKRARIKVDKYYASEVDKCAIEVAQKNYPDTIQLGDIRGIKGKNLPKIDLLIGGSPCQGFSFAGKRLNFDDPRSALFFEYVRLLKEVKPRYFLLENVKMGQESQDVITEHLGAEPIMINSALVSAQNRIRYYWTNIPNIKQPRDKEIFLKDILASKTFKGKRLNKATITGRRLDNRGKRDDYNKAIPTIQCLEVRETNTDKSGCLTTVIKDNVLSTLPAGRHPDVYNKDLPFRYYTPIEYERLQTIPDNYTKGVSDNQRYKMLGNGWTVDVIVHILRAFKRDT